MLKKIFLITIIAVLAYSQVGYFIVMRHTQTLQKEAIKEKILEQLKEDQLDIISLSDNHQKIFWEEEEKEFLLNGEMYDVVKSKTIDGKIMLYCINDKKEKALVDNYNLVTKHNSSSDKKGKNAIDNSIKFFVYQDEKNGDRFAIYDSNKFYSFVPHLTQGIDDKISPPPKA